MAAARPVPTMPNVDLYEKLIAAHPEIERKGAANPYTSVNGHMFSGLNKKGELGLRLSKEDREAFLKKFKTKLFETYGTVMKEYVTVPQSLLRKTKTLLPYLDKSFEYVKSLEPKPTTRKAVAAAKTKVGSKKPAAKKPAAKKPAAKKPAAKKTAAKKPAAKKPVAKKTPGGKKNVVSKKARSRK